MPAYNAAKTLIKTYNELPIGIVDDVIIVDDNSDDNTLECARSLGLKICKHDRIGGNFSRYRICVAKIRASAF